MKRFVFMTIVMMISFTPLTGQTLKYYQTGIRYEYRERLLKLALMNTSEEGTTELELYRDDISHARGETLLEEGKIDVAFFPVTKERTTRFRAVEIPILRGILGYRIFLIHQDLQPDFEALENLDQLRTRYTAGFGTHWADREILNDNGIKTLNSSRYEWLFPMLCEKRFDYFPRGINEIWSEYEHYKKECPDLAVETTIALYYPYLVYFFVNKNNPALADRIERGLLMALDDGSFKTLFLEYNREAIERTNLSGRRLFVLENRSLPEGSPVPDTSWLND